jgi:hypothetical protein
MSQDIDLKKIERKAWMSYFEDGLWDIFLGIFIVGWGLMMLTNMAWLAGAWFVVFYTTILGLKKRITYPRMGYVKFGQKQTRLTAKFMLLGVILMLLGVLVFWLFNTGSRPQWLSEYFLLLFGGMIAVVVSLIGYWIGVIRLYLYAALIFVTSALNQWGNIPTKFGLIVSGSIIVVSGLVILIRFLCKYPITPAEESSFNE